MEYAEGNQMQYRINNKNNQKLSVLGYGCLRFTKTGTVIDQKKAEREMEMAVQSGVNYFDTAYTYGGSEVCLGKFLAKGYRNKVNIATKLPHYYIKKDNDAQKYFEEQLTRLQTDHVEYYLMHMLNDTATWERLCGLGIKEWIEEKKAKGEIQNIGFSFHGGTKEFIELIDAYPWDFCQIQYNYMDEHTQAGRKGLKYANKKGIPIVIMEPLRGGRLVFGLPQTAKRIFEKAQPNSSPAKWAFRWLYDQPEVMVVLSGMNDLEQIEENIKIAEKADVGCLTVSERDTISSVVEEINKYIKVPCTGCGYCMPCPKNVDIPSCLHAYNTSYNQGLISGVKTYFMCTVLRKNQTKASQCVSCKKCVKHCPQNIDIPKQLRKAKKRLENPIFKAADFITRKKMKY